MNQAIQPRGAGQLGPADHAKRWTDYDQRILDAALATGRLPDEQIATQHRIARYLGFSRQTIVNKLAGQQFPLHTELKREGGKRGGLASALRRLAPQRGTVAP